MSKKERQEDECIQVLDGHVCVAGGILPELAVLPPPLMNQDSLPCLEGMFCHRPVST